MNYPHLSPNPLQELRIMPYSLEAEQSVLGALFLDENTIDRVASIVNADSFYRHDHRLIWAAALELHAKKSPLDIVTFSEFLGNRDQLAAVGGFAYLGTMAKDTPSAANVVAYAKIVRETYVLRQIIEINEHTLHTAFNRGELTAKEIISQLESKAFKLADSFANTTRAMLPISAVIDTTLDEMQRLSKKKSDQPLLGVTTGSQYLDQHTSGFVAGDLIIVAGRPSMGKTTFAMNSVFAVAKTLPVAVFSMEMPRHQLAQRLLSSTSSIHSDKIRQPWDINDSEWTQLKHHAEQLKQRNIFIDASASLKVADIRASCRRLIRRLEKKFNGLGLIVIDYLQLMAASETKSNRNAEISEITRELKRTALEFNLPIVLLSQLSREVDKRPNKRPIMSDLRDSGAIEQDADMILFLYRDEIYYPNKTENKGKAEIIIRKFRNGQTGTIQQQFQGEYARFCDLDQNQIKSPRPTISRQNKTDRSSPTSTQSVRRSPRHKEVF